MSNRVFAVVILAAVAALGGFWYYTSQQPIAPPMGAAGNALESGDTPKDQPKPILQGWKRPAAMLVISGEMHGYIEPCGCSQNQLGGLSRRADLFEKLRTRAWADETDSAEAGKEKSGAQQPPVEVVGFDLGGVINNSRPSRAQAKLKSAAIISSLKAMHYTILGFGREELQLDEDKLVELVNPTEGFKYVSANVMLFPNGPVSVADVVANEMGRVPWTLATVGSVKIAVTSIVGKQQISETLGDASRNDMIIAVDPAAALKEVMPKLLEAKADLRVLLSHASLKETEALIDQFPDFDVVISVGGPEDPDPKPTRIGHTLLATVGEKGKHVGLVGVYPGAEEPARYEGISIDGRMFQKTERLEEIMRDYQKKLEQEKIARNQKPVQHPGRGDVTPANATFVGAKRCGECHSKAYDKWKTSGHAHAMESLSKGRKGEEATWIDRAQDPECLACHVTGWEAKIMVPYESGYLFEKAYKDRKGKDVVPDLAGQQCENCHGPGSEHALKEQAGKGQITDEVQKWRKFMHLDMSVAEQVCIRCHDGDNSPKFKFPEYWKKIDHKGMKD